MAGLSAAAAAVLVVVLAWWSAEPVYPAPVARGDFEAPAVARGQELRTRQGSALVELGGYARVTMQPNSRLRIEGDERREAVYLEQGEVDCQVTEGTGSFTVRTAIGTVSVAGTQFQVRVFDNEGDGEMLSKKMLVRVVVGAVLVGGAWGVVQLSAGEQQAFAQEKEKNPLEGKKGKVVGTVVKKADNFIEVKGAGEEEARKYFPEWRGGLPAQGGGLDKEILKTFRELKIGSRVEIEWVFHERLRALKVTVLQAPAEKREKSDK
jgi:hypothetical protein